MKITGQNISVRPIADTDKEWIRNIITDSWGSETVIASRPFNTLLLPGFISETNRRSSGVVTFYISGTSLEIVSLNAVTPGKGTGSALIETVKNLAQLQRMKKIWLVTSNDNTDALRFYQKRGFRIVKVHPNAVNEARKIKPSIPLTGMYGIPLMDTIELEYYL